MKKTSLDSVKKLTMTTHKKTSLESTRVDTYPLIYLGNLGDNFTLEEEVKFNTSTTFTKKVKDLIGEETNILSLKSLFENYLSKIKQKYNLYTSSFYFLSGLINTLLYFISLILLIWNKIKIDQDDIFTCRVLEFFIDNPLKFNAFITKCNDTNEMTNEMMSVESEFNNFTGIYSSQLQKMYDNQMKKSNKSNSRNVQIEDHLGLGGTSRSVKNKFRRKRSNSQKKKKKQF